MRFVFIFRPFEAYRPTAHVTHESSHPCDFSLIYIIALYIIIYYIIALSLSLIVLGQLSYHNSIMRLSYGYNTTITHHIRALNVSHGSSEYIPRSSPSCFFTLNKQPCSLYRLCRIIISIATTTLLTILSQVIYTTPTCPRTPHPVSYHSNSFKHTIVHRLNPSNS